MTRSPDMPGRYGDSSDGSVRELEAFVIRHGESVWNAEGRWAGQSDPELTPRGRDEAAAKAGEFQGAGFQAVACSPLLRARETAGILARRLAVPLLAPIPAFTERDIGLMSGLTAAEIDARFPGLRALWHAGDRPEIPGGEPWDAFQQRIRQGFPVLAASGFGRVLVVAHAGVIQALAWMTAQPWTGCPNLDGILLRWRTGDPRPALEALPRLE